MEPNGDIWTQTVAAIATELYIRILSFAPDFVGALLILVIGFVVARLVARGVGSALASAGVAYSHVIDLIVRYALLTIVVVTALDQLGIDTTLLTTALTVLLGGVALALGLALGLGSGEIVRNIIAGFYARHNCSLGHQVLVGDQSGTLKSIGAVKTILQTDKGPVSLPNSALVEEVVLDSTAEAEEHCP
ncbi:MAG: mechanosensitive ion channel domain-containing protein [Anaerolineae bacterium]